MERPILFSTEMVKAILDGTKTQTRRIIKQFPVAGYRWGGIIIEGQKKKDEGMATVVPESNHNYCATGQIKARPPYKVGDILWVRETWAPMEPEISPPEFQNGCLYKASWIDNFVKPDWHPSIHMPREAARIFLKVTDVRVERLQDIHSRDAMKEGFKSKPFEETVKPEYLKELQNIPVEKRGLALMMAPKEMWIEESEIERSPRKWFINLWDKLNAKRYGWETNPFVWVIEFEKINKESK